MRVMIAKAVMVCRAALQKTNSQKAKGRTISSIVRFFCCLDSVPVETGAELGRNGRRTPQLTKGFCGYIVDKCR